jgi:hypothetical protein
LSTSDAGPLVVDAGLAAQGEGKKHDPFMPPYSPNLHVGDLQDANEQEYAVLVSWPLESLAVNVILNMLLQAQ